MNRLLAALVISFSASTSNLASGTEALYQTCAICHGSSAEGNEALAAPQLAGQNYAYLKEQLINFRDGYRGNDRADVRGKVMMARAQGLTNESIEALSTYIYNLTPRDYATKTSGDGQKGRVFYKENCGDCHGSQAQGIATLFAPNLLVIQDWYIRTQTKAYLNGWRGHSQSTTRAKHMRSMADLVINDDELEDVIAWLGTHN
ncbi:MAG: c-type cytochrome [Oceanicoccus sp.]